VKPSFFSLFKRGKYYHRRPIVDREVGTTETKQVQQEYREIERFAVAAIAFCFQYDDEFRKHFWKRICKVEGDPSLEEWSIDIEPSDWCDLVIRNRSSKGKHVHVYAVECKVDAALENHQNPDEDAFWETGGYGNSLTATEQLHAAIRYTVLGYRKSLTKRHPNNRVNVQQKFWRDMESGYNPSGITRALFDSLGNLGIPEFSHRLTNQMKITSDLESAANASRLLQDAADKLGLLWEYRRLGPWSEGPGDWNFGIDITKLPPTHGKSENQRTLARRVEPIDADMAWFGYEHHPTAQRRLSVWFYCGKKNAANTLETDLKLKFDHVKSDENKQSGHIDVIVWATEHSLSGDRDWFISVFEAIGLRCVT
jgi:hypothetical protein